MAMAVTYRITHEALVELLALVCAHGVMGDRDAPDEADVLLAESNEILVRAGVRDVTELNEEIGVMLADLLPEDRSAPLPP